VALVGAEALAGVGEPHARGGILGGTEDQIAISVVLQERERPLVSLEQNRSLQCDTNVSPCQRSQRELDGHLTAAAAQAEGMTRESMIKENRIVTIVCSG